MIRLSINLPKTAHTSVLLEDKDARSIFCYLTHSLMNAVSKTDVKVAPEEVKHLVQESNLREKKEAVPEVPHEDLSEKKFIMTKCPTCGSLIVGNLIVNETVKCKHCGTAIFIDGSALIPGQYKCPDCGWVSKFNVLGKLDTTRCKNCGGPIDMMYNEQKKIYMSTNQFGKEDSHD